MQLRRRIVLFLALPSPEVVVHRYTRIAVFCRPGFCSMRKSFLAYHDERRCCWLSVQRTVPILISSLIHRYAGVALIAILTYLPLGKRWAADDCCMQQQHHHGQRVDVCFLLFLFLVYILCRSRSRWEMTRTDEEWNRTVPVQEVLVLSFMSVRLPDCNFNLGMGASCARSQTSKRGGEPHQVILVGLFSISQLLVLLFVPHCVRTYRYFNAFTSFQSPITH
jgi:hypothetical protein